MRQRCSSFYIFVSQYEQFHDRLNKYLNKWKKQNRSISEWSQNRFTLVKNQQMNLHTFLDKAQAGRYCRPVFFYSLLISLYGVFSSWERVRQILPAVRQTVPSASLQRCLSYLQRLCCYWPQPGCLQKPAMSRPCRWLLPALLLHLPASLWRVPHSGSLAARLRSCMRSAQGCSRKQPALPERWHPPSSLRSVLLFFILFPQLPQPWQAWLFSSRPLVTSVDSGCKRTRKKSKFRWMVTRQWAAVVVSSSLFFEFKGAEVKK